MGIQARQDITLQSLVLSANGNFAAVDVSIFDAFAIQVVFDMSGGATSAGTLSLQYSLDGTNWVTQAGSAFAYTAASTNTLWDIAFTGIRFVRINVAFTSGTGGTAAVRLLGKYPMG